MQPVSVERAMQQPTPRGIDYGSLVEVKTLNRRTAKFRVTDITPEGLGGSPGFYRYEDMKSLRVQNENAMSSDNTWEYILAALGIVGLVAIILNADSVSVCSPGPCPQPQP